MSANDEVSLVRVPKAGALDVATRRDHLRSEAAAQRDRATPENTDRAYKSDWAQFEAWCSALGYDPLPAHEEALSSYLLHLSRDRCKWKRKKGPLAGQELEGFAFEVTSIERKLSAIVRKHTKAKYPSPRTPLVMEQMRAIWAERESKPRGSAPVLGEHLRTMVACMQDVIASRGKMAGVAIRDRAVMLVGWHGAMRRSEITNLKYDSVEISERGLSVYIGRSKTDQKGKGRTLWLKPVKSNELACPVAALRDWIDVRGSEAGPLFWHARKFRISRGEKMAAWQLVTVIDRWVRIAQIKPETADSLFTPHGLRAGFITHAVRKKRPIKETMEHSGHRSLETFMGYVRTAEGFERTVQDGILDDDA